VCIIDSPGLPKWENFAECRSLGNEAHSCLFIEMSVRRCSVDLDGSGSETAASRQTTPHDLNRGRIGDQGAPSLSRGWTRVLLRIAVSRLRFKGVR
jgi:hypothetical protein